MPRNPQEESGSQTAEQRRGSGHIREWIDVIAKLAGSVAIIVAALAGAWLANSYQRKVSGTTLLSEREQAEGQLRASMFSSLIGPIVGHQKGEGISAEGERLLVELLALNFHEHFELKPLFERVDRRLASEGIKGIGRQQAQKARGSLRSIARRIIDRQIAALRKEGSRNGSAGEGAAVYSLTITEQPQNGEQQKDVEMLARAAHGPYQAVGQAGEPISDLRSPDGKYKLTLVVFDPDWENQTFKVQIAASGAKSTVEDSAAPFTLTWFDFPLTDNTLFPDGNRFALVVSSVLTEGRLRNAMLKLIWFPKDYFTPRERPLDYGEFLKLVGKKTE